MDAFEYIISKVLSDEGYWTIIGYKVDLSKEDRRAINNPSMPRPEIDIIAYKPSTNELLIVECKSYLDSQGVGHRAFTVPDSPNASRYKLFNRPELYEMVSKRLIQQLKREGRITTPLPKPQLCLAAGKIYSDHEVSLHAHFDKMGWKLFTPQWVAGRIRNLAEKGYENEVMTVVTKILERP
jgi:hypothetical protein